MISRIQRVGQSILRGSARPAGSLFPPADRPAAAEGAALERWVSRRLGGVAHERRVAEIADRLFDLTRPLHGLGARARRLLAGGALVHDVGRSIDRDDHPERGARLLLDDPSAPLPPARRRWLAYLTLYHRDDVPPLGRDALLRPGDDRPALRTLLALLRAADALDSRSADSRSAESPRLVFALGPRPTKGAGRRTRVTLRVSVFLRRTTPKALKTYGRRRKFKLLQEVLGCDVDVRVRAGEALPRVA